MKKQKRPIFAMQRQSMAEARKSAFDPSLELDTKRQSAYKDGYFTKDGIEHAPCVGCGAHCSTHDDAANPLDVCGDCGGVTCPLHRKHPHDKEVEERLSDVVYHQTELEHGLSILNTNKFHLATSVPNEFEHKYNKGKSYFMSTARNLSSDYFANGPRHYSVKFTLNGQSLGANNRAVNNTQYFSNRDEMEDRIISDKPTIPNARKHITAAHVFVRPASEVKKGFHPDYEREHLHNLSQFIITAKKHGIPTHVYTDKDAYRLQDTRRAINPVQHLKQAYAELGHPTREPTSAEGRTIPRTYSGAVDKKELKWRSTHNYDKTELGGYVGLAMRPADSPYAKKHGASPAERDAARATFHHWGDTSDSAHLTRLMSNQRRFGGSDRTIAAMKALVGKPDPAAFASALRKKWGTVREGLSDELFHVTGLHNAHDIVKSNHIHMTYVGKRKGGDADFQKGRDYFFSTTHSKDSDYIKSSAAHLAVTLNLNGQTLGHNLKGGPINYWSGMRGAGNYTAPNEMEDRIISHKPTIENARKHINSIHVMLKNGSFDPRTFRDGAKQHVHIFSDLLKTAKQHKIPVHVYGNEKDFITQNPNKRLNPVDVVRNGLKETQGVGNWSYAGRTRQRKAGMDFAPYQELAFHKGAPNQKLLSPKAARKLYSIKYHQDTINGLEADIHNNRTQGGSIKFVKAMKAVGAKDHKDFLDKLRKRWEPNEDFHTAPVYGESIKPGEYATLYKNPTEEEWAKIPHDARGWVSHHGHLFVSADTGIKSLHRYIKQAAEGTGEEVEDPYNQHGITVHRVGGTRHFAIGHSEIATNPAGRFMKPEHHERIKALFHGARKNNPTVQFHMKAHRELAEALYRQDHPGAEFGFRMYKNPTESELQDLHKFTTDEFGPEAHFEPARTLYFKKTGDLYAAQGIHHGEMAYRIKETEPDLKHEKGMEGEMSLHHNPRKLRFYMRDAKAADTQAISARIGVPLQHVEGNWDESFHEPFGHAGNFFHNPTAEEWEKIPAKARGYVTHDGHLFMSGNSAETSWGFHSNLMNAIRVANVHPGHFDYLRDKENHHGVSVQRVGSTKHLTVGESEAYFPHEETMREVEERRRSHMRAAKKNNPGVVFHLHGYKDDMGESRGIRRLSEAVQASKFTTNYLPDTYQLSAKGLDSILINPDQDEFQEWVRSFQAGGKRYGRWILSESGDLFVWWGPLQWTRVQQELARSEGYYGPKAASVRAAGRYYNQSSKLEFESVLSHPVEMKRVADEVVQRFQRYDADANIMLPFSRGTPVDVRLDAQIGYKPISRATRVGMI